MCKWSDIKGHRVGLGTFASVAPCQVSAAGLESALFHVYSWCRRSTGGKNKTLGIPLTLIIEISHYFYYLAAEMDVILVGFNTPASTALAPHLAKYKTRPELKLKSSASYLLPTGKQICVENRKIKRRARIA